MLITTSQSGSMVMAQQSVKYAGREVPILVVLYAVHILGLCCFESLYLAEV